jgi:hypothetical protein
MTLDIRAARERCEAATDGPWWVGGKGGGIECADYYVAHHVDPEDAAFMAHARTDLPEALDLLERCRVLLGDIDATDDRPCPECQRFGASNHKRACEWACILEAMS